MQNRLRPDGALIADGARGLFMGNRGILHDPRTKTVSRRWATRTWIICLTQFKGRHREVMGPGSYTEIFMLDEVTGLAAGHRPCFECRRERARAFAAAFATGNGVADARASAMDRVLHGQRVLSSRTSNREISPDELAGLPDGAMVEAEGNFLALARGRALPWDFSGYGEAIALSHLARKRVVVVTPAATIAALGAGYRPHWHATAAM